MKYEDFLSSKRLMVESSGINAPGFHPALFPFQRDITRWALGRGRAAVFADCGLGKTWIALEWARVVSENAGNVLILTPLAVAQQFRTEAIKIGIEATVCRDQADVRPGINVANYERLHLFNAGLFAGVVLDESSILKDFTGATRNAIIAAFESTPFRLACTATPSPNDHAEIGNHAEFLGVMSRVEMLSAFFVHTGKKSAESRDWRIKGHAVDTFWRWVCSWAVAIRMPGDLGYDNTGFDLPPLRVSEHVVEYSAEMAQRGGMLFALDVRTLSEQREARKSSVSERVRVARDLVAAEPREPWLIWCDLNAESDALAKAIPGAVEVRGSMTSEEKTEAMARFSNGSIRVLVTKPSICGWGLNWQHCARVIFVGITHSFEAWYQAIRRTWRFGQSRAVYCHLIRSTAEGFVMASLKKKQDQAQEMTRDMIAQMAPINAEQIHKQERETDGYAAETVALAPFDFEIGLARVLAQHVAPRFAVYNADCCEILRSLPEASIDYSIFSPPFSSLYTYSNSERDLGNCRTNNEFFAHLDFLIPELLRVLKPGRSLSFHCMLLPATASRDGYIGLKDFRGDLIRSFIKHGFIHHSEVVIWKDPVSAMQRTKALGLLYKQLRKDSCVSRQGLPDYLITMRKPGDNSSRVTHTQDEFPLDDWQEYASPVWMDINASDTLQYRSARQEEDERHICPLQLEVIRRALRLMSNPGDIVLSPFAGIGSEGFVSLEMGRRFIGTELKRSYYEQAVANLDGALRQSELFPNESRTA